MKNFLTDKIPLLSAAAVQPLFAFKSSGYRTGISHSHDAFELVFHETDDGVIEYPDGTVPFSNFSWSLTVPNTEHRQMNRGSFTDLCLFFKLKESWACPFQHIEFAPGAGAFPSIAEIKKLVAVSHIPQSGWLLTECTARTLLILSLLMQSESCPDPDNKSRNLLYAEQVELMIRQNGYTDLRLSEAAEMLGISPDHLRHSYLEARGCRLKQYKDRIRLKYASYLLRYSDMQIREIAHRCGFRSASHFSLFFRNSLHVLPENFRNEKR